MCWYIYFGHRSVFLVAIISIVGCMIWQRRRLMGMITKLKNPLKHRNKAPREADHAQAIGLLFRNGRANRQVGPFLIDEGEEEVSIRCRRGELEGFLKNFDAVKLQHELVDRQHD